MAGNNGRDADSEAATYLLPKDSHSPLQSAVQRPVNKAQSAEEGREYFPTPPKPSAADVAPPPTLLEQACAALFYAVASLLVIFVNKLVLTSWGFPSFFFIAVSQFTSTCLVLSLARLTGHVKLARFDRATARAVAPLMMYFLLNTVSGLGGTQRISLPMFTVLRRFSILMTMVLERYILNTVTSSMVQLSVAMMIGGSVMAAYFDLNFELKGYLLILMNDFFTAAYGISIKRALNLNIPQTSLLFFNSLFGAIAMTMIVLIKPGETERIVEFGGWRDSGFICLYLCTSFMGSVLQYSIFLCTRVNSALTTSVVGCAKNLLTTVVGMLGFGHDYEFGMLNCAGMAVSMAGSFLYSWAKWGAVKEVRLDDNQRSGRESETVETGRAGEQHQQGAGDDKESSGDDGQRRAAKGRVGLSSSGRRYRSHRDDPAWGAAQAAKRAQREPPKKPIV
eukprot:g6532.t1